MLSRSTQAKLTMTAGAASLAGGAYGLAGWPVAAMVGGVYLLVYGVQFIDVDDAGKPPKRRRVIER